MDIVTTVRMDKEAKQSANSTWFNNPLINYYKTLTRDETNKKANSGKLDS